MIWFVILAAGLIVAMLSVTFAPRNCEKRTQALRQLVRRLGGFNLLLVLMVVGLGVIWLLAPNTVRAAGLTQEAGGDPYAALAAALAVGVGSVGAGYAVGSTGSAAIGVIAERPEAFGRVLIFVGLAEGIAIYGLIIAFMILGG